MTAIQTGIYTLTPTHVGSGQANGAVDLPIAREELTGLPLLPATALKGVARDLFERAQGDAVVQRLFGSPPPGLQPREGSEGLPKGVLPGSLVFHDAQLVAYPFRSLQRAFVHATCPLLIQRLARLLRATGLASNLPEVEVGTIADEASAPGGLLVLEDAAVTVSAPGPKGGISEFGQYLSRLLPASERVTRDRLASGLVCLDDDTFLALVRTAPPVHARVQLTSGKTTDSYRTPEGREEKGNLWYEETLPSDALFVSVVATRQIGNAAESQLADDLDTLKTRLGATPSVQIGGNETVGYGLCWWQGENDGK